MYQRIIVEQAKKMGVNVDSRHVEAWMRLQYDTLDHLPIEKFKEYISLVIQLEKYEPGSSEALAESYGL